MSDTLALFDFDGTVTRRDSLFHFLSFLVSKPTYLRKIAKCFPWMLGFKLGLISNSRAKQALFGEFCRGMKVTDLDRLAKKYTHSNLQSILRPKAIDKLHWHQSQGHRIVLVSASLDIWLHHWCRSQKIELLATIMESRNEIVTGGFASPNCYGQEKVTRIKELVELQTYSSIYVYGDSSGDKEMLSIASHPAYKPFR